MSQLIVYFLILFIISNGIGKLLLKSESKYYNFRAIIGFCLLLFALQIGYYPMQYFRLNSIFTNIWTSIILLPLLIYGITKLRKEDFYFFKHYEFYLLFILVFVVCKIIPLVEAGDDWFYMPLIKENAFTNAINSIQPKTGWGWNVDELYKYQGYYLLMSFIYFIQETLFASIINIFITFRSLMSLLFITFASILLINIKTVYLKKDNKWIVYLIEACSILLVAFLEWSHIYWGSFAIFTIFIPLYMFLFNEYFKDEKLKWILLIINGALLTLASTALFLSTFITFSFFIYSLYLKKVKVEDYLLIMMPLFLYLTFFIEMPYLLIPLLIIVLIIFKFKDIMNKLINKIDYRFTFIIPILMFSIGLLLNLNFTWNIYRLSNIILIFNIIVTLLVFYKLYKKEKVSPILFAFAIFVTFFFNPLVGPIISKYFTTDQVYYRLFYITKNPIVIFIILYCIYDNFRNKKYLKYGYIILLIIIVGRYSYILFDNTVNIESKSSYNYLLRSDNDSNALAEQLEKVNIDRAYVVSIYFAPRIYNNKYITIVHRYPELNTYRDDIFNKVLYQNIEITEEDYFVFDYNIEKNHIKYIIILNNKKVAKRIKNFKEIYSNNTYILLEKNN